MFTHRFGRKIKLPSTVAIKHQILKLMLQDHLKAQILNAPATEGIDVDGQGDVSWNLNAIDNPRGHLLQIAM